MHLAPRSVMDTRLCLALASSLFVLGGAGCSAPEPTDLDTTSQDVTQVCGAKTTGPVQGVDVSHYQGNFDWVAAKVDFGYAQVSDGITSPDAMFDTNWANMKKAHVLRGAYQFFRPGQDEVAQANLLVKKVGKLAPGDLPAMIDVEVTDGQTAAVMAAKIRKWIQIVTAGTGLQPFIYSGSYFWQDNVMSTAFGSTPIWIAAYGSTCPSVPPGWKSWLFWQYSDGAGKLDHDVFNGTLAQLHALSPAATDGGASHDAGAGKDAMGPEVSDPDASLGPSDPDTTATPPDGNELAPLPDADPPPHASSGCTMSGDVGQDTRTAKGLGAVLLYALALFAGLRARRRGTRTVAGASPSEHHTSE